MNEVFWGAQNAWAEKAFGPRETRGPIGPLKHLAKEVQEVLNAPSDIEEYADVIFLVYEAAWRAGFSYTQLREACWTKLEKNKARKWPKPVADEPVEHVRNEEV